MNAAWLPLNQPLLDRMALVLAYLTMSAKTGRVLLEVLTVAVIAANIVINPWFRKGANKHCAVHLRVRQPEWNRRHGREASTSHSLASLAKQTKFTKKTLQEVTIGVLEHMQPILSPLE